MTNIEMLRRMVEANVTHILFEYNGKDCGIDPFAPNDIDIWCGDKAKSCTSVDEVMNEPLFDGKSLNEIADEIADQTADQVGID